LRVGKGAEIKHALEAAVACKRLLHELIEFYVGDGLLGLTRGMQWNNRVSDEGACGLGDGLEVNSSLEMLQLVGGSVFHFRQHLCCNW
jgi:hypothetical protein